MLYIISPDVSSVDATHAREFLDAVEDELDDLPHTIVTASQLVSCNPGEEDGVAFFNPLTHAFEDDAEALLERAVDAAAVLLPIAMTQGDRHPPAAAGVHQSFEVVDHLRRRSLPATGWLHVAGHAFAREAMSLMMPTFVQSRLRLFLCHRREDGEELAALTDRALSARHEHVFRDLIDIQAGDCAQERIDEHLAGADVVVFFDTPRAHESWWIRHELATAMGRGIPVVWIRLGPEDAARDAALWVKPDAAPHIERGTVALEDEAAGALADEIVRVATRLARRHLATSKRALNDLRRWAKSADASVQVLDARRQIFQVRYADAATRRYPTREATDVIQLFGRVAGPEDRSSLETFLTDSGMGPHDQACRAFDAAILLDPTSRLRAEAGEWAVTEHPAAYVASLRGDPAAHEPPRLLLLGAFPSGDYARDQLTSAVHATAVTWLSLGGQIVCGGHPTFVPLLTEAARLALDGADTRPTLTVFWSEWYAAPAQIEDLQAHATVVVTPRKDSSAESLTVMRELMVADGHADKVLAIGGRTHEGGTHIPGIDEEIRLARMAGLPVFLLGAPGGRATELADVARTSRTPWSELGNGLDDAENRRLQLTEDYEEAARAIWNAPQAPNR